MIRLGGIFNRRFRGFRVVHVAAFALLAGLVLAVYLTKTTGGREAADLATVNHRIETETRRIKMLRAELAYLERPERLERLATRYLDLGPVPAERETQPAGLAEVARHARSGAGGRP